MRIRMLSRILVMAAGCLGSGGCILPLAGAQSSFQLELANFVTSVVGSTVVSLLLDQAAAA